VTLKLLSCRSAFVLFGAAPLVGGALFIAGCSASASGGEDAVAINLLPATVAQADESIDFISADSPPEVTEPTAAGSYLSALVAANNRDMAAAANYFLLTLDTDPDNPELLRQTHLALIMAGRVDEAVPIAERIDAIEPNDGVAPLTLTAAAIHNGDLEAASRYLGELPLSGYNVVLVPLVEAWIDVGRGDTLAALEAISSGLTDDGFASFRAYHIAMIEALGGHPEEADKAFQIAMQAQEGGAYRVVRAYGAFLKEQGRIDEAREVYQNFERANPGSMWLDDAMHDFSQAAAGDDRTDTAAEGTAEALFGIASSADTSTSGSTALIYAQLAAYLDPSSDVIHLLIGDLLDGEGQWLDAIAAFERIPDDSPLGWSARLRAALDYDRVGQSDEAIARLRSMVQEQPDRSDALITLGDMLRSQERWDESVEAYDKAIALMGEAANENWRVHYVRGISLERADNWARAEEDFLAALEINPDNPYVLNYLGYTWVDEGVHLDEALDMIKRAVEQRPQDGYIVDSLGWALYRLEDYEGAVRYLERAVELEPGDPVINDHLGDAYWQVGRHMEARFQWKRALALSEDDQELIAPIQAKLEGGLDAGG